MLSNSVKFTTEGAIMITVLTYDTYLGIVIQDQGSGIKMENLEKIGQEFETYNNDEN
jgi:signal transduction histidine kinase